MAKHNRHQKISPETQNEAIKAAKATQRPGQSKEQTKLIALGIQKGIDHYKKQQKAKSRELNKKLHKISQSPDNNPVEQGDEIVKQSVLAWFLLLLSWAGFIGYYFLMS